MSFFKKIGRGIKKAVRGVENFGRKQLGKDKIGESTRSEAADQMLGQQPVKKDVGVIRQAGQGQIKYTGEELV